MLVARVDDAPEHLRDPHVAELVGLVAAHRDGRRRGEELREGRGAQRVRDRVGDGVGARVLQVLELRLGLGLGSGLGLGLG